MVVPVVIFILCFAGGVYAATRWLPDFAPDRSGLVTFFAVSGLLGAALAVFGLRVYSVVEQVAQAEGWAKRYLLAEGLAVTLWETGMVAALAVVVMLLAPRREGSAARTCSRPLAEAFPGLIPPVF